MRRGVGSALLAAATLCAAACAGSSATYVQPLQQPLCKTNGVSVFTDFEGAGHHVCTISGEDEIVLSVAPEGEPINPSPYYAFRLEAPAPSFLRITLDYSTHEHRYTPKWSRDRQVWRTAPDDAVTVSPNAHEAVMDVALQTGATWIAAQPLQSPSEALDAVRIALADAGFTERVYGHSIDGRPLIGFVGGSAAPYAPLIVALTRQHPPETTGAAAFMAFVQTLAAPEAAAFRNSHRIMLAPMPNPDGVASGNWRWNNGGQDLNRDWGFFAQLETQALGAFIESEAQGRTVEAFFDFHSTQQSVVYAPALDADSPTIAFLPFLQNSLRQKLGAQAPQWTFNHRVNSGTSKGWALDVLHAPGITVELGDEVSDAFAQEIGETVAFATIEYFDSTDHTELATH